MITHSQVLNTLNYIFCYGLFVCFQKQWIQHMLEVSTENKTADLRQLENLIQNGFLKWGS